MIRTFHGVKELTLTELGKCRGSGLIEIVRALKENYSMHKLDISQNKILPGTFSELIYALEENHVLQEVRIDVKKKALPGVSMEHAFEPIKNSYYLNLTQAINFLR